jgi:hypothetical protein
MLWVALLASLIVGAHGYNHFAEGKPSLTSLEMSGHHITAIFRSPSVKQNAALPERGERKEKRHGKSLITEAIVADYTPTIALWFIYFERHYSPYLPGGCCRQTFGNFSLRGPPATV